MSYLLLDHLHLHLQGDHIVFLIPPEPHLLFPSCPPCHLEDPTEKERLVEGEIERQLAHKGKAHLSH